MNKDYEVDHKFDIDNKHLHENFIDIINNILWICRKEKMKDTNPILVKYRKMKQDIKNSIDKNKFCIKLSIGCALNNFNPSLFIHRIKLLYQIYVLEDMFKIIYKQYMIRNKNKLFKYQHYK
jgi:hypothetical protein